MLASWCLSSPSATYELAAYMENPMTNALKLQRLAVEAELDAFDSGVSCGCTSNCNSDTSASGCGACTVSCDVTSMS
jgi:hypothetical protein